MPSQRQSDNTGLISALAGYAETYHHQQSPGLSANYRAIKIIQTFELNKTNVENLCKIFYNSELDVGDWGGVYKIVSLTLSGTIHESFFYIADVDVDDATSFLLDIYTVMFRRGVEYANENDYETFKFAEGKLLETFRNQAVEVGGSGSNAIDLITKATGNKISDRDFIRIEFLLRPELGARFSDNLANDTVINDKVRVLRMGRVVIDESMNRILAIRHRNRDPYYANVIADETPYDEDYLYERDMRHTELERGIPETMHYYNLRPRQQINYSDTRRRRPQPARAQPYQLRPRQRIDYTPYFRTSQGRASQRRRIGRGADVAIVNLHDSITNYLLSLFS